MASKADVYTWEVELVKFQTEYVEVSPSKMKVAVLYSMMPKDFQEKILDSCAVDWDGTSEAAQVSSTRRSRYRSRIWQKPAVRCKVRSR